MSDRIRLAIASDYCLTRCGLRQLLKQEPDFEVIAETDFPGELAPMQSQHAPDVILLIPRMDQAYCPATLVKGCPQSPIVLITSNENLGYVRTMLSVGVLGYVVRKASDAELSLAVRSVSRGHRFIDPRLSDSWPTFYWARPCAASAARRGSSANANLRCCRLLLASRGSDATRGDGENGRDIPVARL